MDPKRKLRPSLVFTDLEGTLLGDSPDEIVRLKSLRMHKTDQLENKPNSIRPGMVSDSGFVRLMERERGAVSVQTSPSSGSIFILHVPIAT